MADYIPRVEKEEEPQTISVGGNEYSQEDLDRLVGLGQIATEAESKYNIKIDKVWSNHTQVINEKKALEEQIENMKAMAMKPDTPPVDVSVQDELQKAQALKAAKDLGILTQGDLEGLGFMTKDSFSKELQRELAVQKLVDKAVGFEKSLDGTDGRPKFNQEEILGFMEQTGIQDMEIAYKVKNEEALDAWKSEKITKAAGMKTGFESIEASNAGSAKTPKSVKITRENLDEMIAAGMKGELN